MEAQNIHVLSPNTGHMAQQAKLVPTPRHVSVPHATSSFRGKKNTEGSDAASDKLN
jgi:hypothetical protein